MWIPSSAASSFSYLGALRDLWNVLYHQFSLPTCQVTHSAKEKLAECFFLAFLRILNVMRSQLVQPIICEDSIYSNSSTLPKNETYDPKMSGKSRLGLPVSIGKYRGRTHITLLRWPESRKLLKWWWLLWVQPLCRTMVKTVPEMFL